MVSLTAAVADDLVARFPADQIREALEVLPARHCANPAVHCARLVRASGDALLTGAEPSADRSRLRLGLAALSAASQRSWAIVGRSPFAFRLWYLADVAAVMSGVPKMDVLAWLFPPYVEQVLQQGPRSPWGEAARAADVLAQIFELEHGQSVASLLDRSMAQWRTPRTVPDISPVDLAEEALTSWPEQLAGLTTVDVTSFFARAMEEAP